MVCHDCKLTEDAVSIELGSPTFNERGKMIDHIMQHSLKNHKIPAGLVARLIGEIREKGEKIQS